jgi:hypothetical protein
MAAGFQAMTVLIQRTISFSSMQLQAKEFDALIGG